MLVCVGTLPGSQTDSRRALGAREAKRTERLPVVVFGLPEVACEHSILDDQAKIHARRRIGHGERFIRPAVRFDLADAADPGLDAMVGGSGALGRGGMITKLKAARLAARSGAHTVIASGSEPANLKRILAGEAVGTLLAASVSPLDARKRWIAGQQRVKGRLTLDAGAVTALRERGVSLLPVGVTAVSGEFSRGELVACQDAEGRVMAQGLSNYSSDETALMLGAGSDVIVERLGYRLEPELIHRDNLVVLS